MGRLRVVLDTNVLVSGLAYPGSIPGRIVGAWRQGGLEVALSRFLMEELVRVLPRLNRLQMGPEAIRDLADSLWFLADVVELEESTEAALRDPNDQPVLQTLLSSNAQYLVTGDKDLLVLADRYPILTPAEFWDRHGS